jgi:nicotinate phosphoribosyltransferase
MAQFTRPFMQPHHVFAPVRDEPIIESRLDCDIYKYIMAYFIWKQNKHLVPVEFALKVRNPDIKLGRVIPIEVLREQLEHIKQLRLTDAQAAFLMGMTVVTEQGTRHLFEIEFIDYLKQNDTADFELYEKDGNIYLRFKGPWIQTMFWETMAMATISELYYWSLWKREFKAGNVTKTEFGRVYAQMFLRLCENCDLLGQYPLLTWAQFGHRRRHARSWEWFVQMVFEELVPGQCLAPSNVQLAMDMGIVNPKGTNAHELPMVWANLGDDSDDWIRRSQYDVVEKWNETLPGLETLLGDTFGTVQFINGASPALAHATRVARLDSMVEEKAIPLYIDWWKRHDVDPMTRILVPSDGLTAQRMVDLWKQFHSVVNVLTYGWGTQATNNCNGLWIPEFRTIPMVIKVVMANGLATVKLSDNPGKITGESSDRNARFERIFGHAGMATREIVV